MSENSRTVFRWKQYAAALMLVASAAVVRLLFLLQLGLIAPYLTFYPAVMLSAAYGGLRSGLLATALAAVLADYFWIAPVGQLGIHSQADMLAMIIFLINCTLVSVICEVMLRARRKARLLADDTQELNARLREQARNLEESNASLEEEITERAMAEERIRGQAELLDLAYDFILVRDLDNRIIYWNRGAEIGYGFSAGEAVGQVKHTLLQTVFPESAEHVMNALLRQGRWEGELLHTRKDGEQLVVKSHQTLRRNAAGEPAAILEINHDITAYKTAVKKLQNSEVRYRNLFDNMQDIFVLRRVIVDDLGRPADLEYVEVNAAFERLRGVRADQVIGRRWTEIAPWVKSDYPEGLERLGQVALTGQPTTFEAYSRRSGRHILIFAYCPEPGYVANIVVDITERALLQQRLQEINATLEEEIAERQAAQEALAEMNAGLEQKVVERTAELQEINATLEEEIAERQAVQEALTVSETQYRDLFDHMESAFILRKVLLDESGRPADLEQVMVNRTFLRRYGWREEDVVGRKLSELFPGIEKEEFPWIQTLGDVALSGRSVEFEAYSPAVGKWFGVSAYSPEPGLVATITEDISTRKNAEEALRESQEWYEAVMKQSSEGIAIIDFATDKIVEINAAFVRLFGYPPEVVLGLSTSDIGLFTSEETATIDVALVDNGAWSSTTVRRYPRKGGRAVYAEMAAVLINHRDKRLKILSCRDVAEQQKLQSEIQHQVELAGTVQQSLLTPDYQDDKLTIRTIFAPATLVSGDFYGYRWFHDGSILHGYLIDVTGHGVATALYTSAISSLLNEIMDAKDAWTPEALSRLNRYANNYLPDNSFVALIAFTLDLRARRLTCTSCGITSLLVATKARTGLMSIRGLYLGAADSPEAETAIFPVRDGDAFYFMTDGISERLPASAGKKAGDFKATVEVLKAVALKGNKEDDCSALCLRIGQRESLPRILEFKKADNKDQLQNRISRILGRLAGEDAPRLEMALGEALSNAGKSGANIRVKISKLGSRLILRVKDDGPGFDGNSRIRQYLATGLAGVFEKNLDYPNGRGIPIMIAWTDRVLYSGKGNEVMLVKRLNGDNLQKGW
ncbi:MAG: PAS domain S-box protein [Negativicutes bacterium]|nr:PAS domain S-box protein [Negativicutes bacterium]